MKLSAALEKAGIELINEGMVSHGGGRGVELEGITDRFGSQRASFLDVVQPSRGLMVE